MLKISLFLAMALVCLPFASFADAPSATSECPLPEKAAAAPDSDAIKKVYAEESARSAQELIRAMQDLQNDSRDTQRKALAMAWDLEVRNLDQSLECLGKRNRITTADADAIRASYLMAPSPFRAAYEQLYRDGLTDDERKAINVSDELYRKSFDLAVAGKFKFQAGNALQVLVDGKPYRQAVLDTLRGAKRFANISSLHLAEDRFGDEIAHELIGKKLGYKDGDDFRASLVKDGLDLHKDWKTIQRNFLKAKLGSQVDLGDQKKIDETIASLTKEFEVHLLLDFFTVKLSVFKNADVGAGNNLPLLRHFGAEVAYVASFIFFVNHVKFVASENQVVIGGGNFIDKVANFNWGAVEFHDTSFKVRGPLVNDFNRFFITQYNRYVNVNGVARMLDVVGMLSGLYRDRNIERMDPERKDSAGEPYFFPTSNDKPATADKDMVAKAEGRLIYAVNDGKVEATVNWKGIKKAINDAQKLVILENPFFTEQKISDLLIAKARKWDLYREKEQNGEFLNAEGKKEIVATCSLEKIQSRKNHRGVVVILPKHHDQRILEIATISLINPLLKAGVDVCRWSGAVYNQHKKEALAGAQGPYYDQLREDPEKGYTEDSMLHAKVWAADDLSYIGTANLTVRSLRGDLELGVMTTDPAVTAQVRGKITDLDLWNSEPTRARPFNGVGFIVRFFFTRIFPAM